MKKSCMPCVGPHRFVADEPVDADGDDAGPTPVELLLAAVGIDLTPFEGIALGKATVDDVLDAAVAAWTAGRIADGTARRLPADPGDDPEDVIWA